MTKFRPFGQFVLVKQHEAEAQTKGGIQLPEIAKRRPFKGDVIEVGPKAERAKAGQVVYFAQGVGVEFVIDGVKHLVIDESDLYGEVVESEG